MMSLLRREMHEQIKTHKTQMPPDMKRTMSRYNMNVNLY